MAKNKMKSHRGACKRFKITGSGKSTILTSADLKRMLRSMGK